MSVPLDEDSELDIVSSPPVEPDVPGNELADISVVVLVKGVGILRMELLGPSLSWTESAASVVFSVSESDTLDLGEVESKVDVELVNAVGFVVIPLETLSLALIGTKSAGGGIEPVFTKGGLELIVL
jgi:hypothetical protein